MIQISEYDFTQPSMRKAWKAEFRQYLIEYYKPSLVNADIIFNAITLVDSFVKKHTAIERKLLSLVSENDVVDIRSKMLSHQPFAMGAFISAHDKKVIVLDRYIEFLRGKIPVPLQQDIIEPAQTSEYDIRKATEGLWKETSYFLRSRNRSIRNQCAERDHYTCQICGFNFEHQYGERGKGFIEVHHLKPLSSYDEEHEIPIEDLISLCSNCHSMIHYGGKLLTPTDLIINK